MTTPAQDPPPEPQHDADARVAGLRRHSTRRTEEAVTKAEKAIRALVRDGARITFTSVARTAGVSTRFLRDHPDLTDRIRTLSAQQRGHTETLHAATATGENAVIAALRTRLREQEERHRREVATLRAQLRDNETQIAALYGQLHSSTEGSL